jgi:hypothetical protein
VAVAANGTAAYTSTRLCWPTPATTTNVVENRSWSWPTAPAAVHAATVGQRDGRHHGDCTALHRVDHGRWSATAAQVQSAVLGTVDDAAVRDDSGNLTPRVLS